MVLSFTGAPAGFPIQEAHVGLQKYLVWSDTYNEKAETFIQQNLKRPFLGIHMRNGMDWVSILALMKKVVYSLTKHALLCVYRKLWCNVAIWL